MLSQIRELGKKAGAVLDPASPIAFVEQVLHLCDIVLVMTVNPGFRWAEIPPGDAAENPRAAAALQSKGLDPWIEVDGGEDSEHAPLAIAAGANAIVAGSAIFGSSDYRRAIARIRGDAPRARIVAQ